jgi:PAS domain-containing protein
MQEAAVVAYGRRALADMPGRAIVVGPHGRIVYANDAARTVMGMGDYVVRSFADFFSDHANEANDDFYEMFLSAVYDKSARQQGRCAFVAPDGTRYVLRFLSYIPTALIQEFLTRGIMQESLCHVFMSKYRESMAIIISTLMFATLHLSYTPFYMLAAGLLLLVFGIIYKRQRSIWGLALIHFTFGMTAAMLGII